MNNRLLCLGLALLCAPAFAAHLQEPPGCSVKSASAAHVAVLAETPTEPAHHSKRKKARNTKTSNRKRSVHPTEFEDLHGPVIASPIYLPQPGQGSAAAITESRGYLYVVVGQRLYKVDEKTLRTVQTSPLGLREERETKSAASPKKRKRLASDEDGSPRRGSTRKHDAD